MVPDGNNSARFIAGAMAGECNRLAVPAAPAVPASTAAARQSEPASVLHLVVCLSQSSQQHEAQGSFDTTVGTSRDVVQNLQLACCWMLSHTCAP